MYLFNSVLYLLVAFDITRKTVKVKHFFPFYILTRHCVFNWQNSINENRDFLLLKTI